MSRPKVWTGSVWKDPSFWTGSAWKTYTPPAYETEMPDSNYQFTSTVEGWTAQTNTGAIPPVIVSGSLKGEVEEGLLGYVYLNSPVIHTGEINGTANVKARFNIRVVSEAGTTSPNPIECHVQASRGFGDDYTTAFNVAPGTSTAYVVRETPTFQISPGTTFSLEAYADAGALSGYGLCFVYLDYVQVIDQATNEVIKVQSSPGWEPKVWNGSSWI